VIDPPRPPRERDHSLLATTQRVTATRPRTIWGWIEGRIVIDMVQLRTLTSGDHTHFPLWISDLGGEPALQTNGLSEWLSVFGRFWGYQILPNFTNFYQKCVAKGVRRGSKRHLTRGFPGAIYLNRVKSGGSCQCVIGAPFFQKRSQGNRGFSPRHRGGKSRKADSFSVLCQLCALARNGFCISKRPDRLRSPGSAPWGAQSRHAIDSRMVAVATQWLSRRSDGMLNSKHLIAKSPASVWPPFRVLPGERNVPRAIY